MVTARLLTIGTEIANGEVVNSNASWISRKLEEMGIRVLSHLSVRDSKEEILQALQWPDSHSLLFITGGLGPTSDDITRDCVAEHCGLKLEFDDGVWHQLEELYRSRGLPLREAHRRQCYFPAGSERLSNAVGTALGFMVKNASQTIFVLPGPPREMEGMWSAEVAPRVKAAAGSARERWIRWTCLGAPESEVAEIVEPLVAGREVGYRAQVPYVRVTVYADPSRDRALIDQLEEAMKPWIVARAEEDLAEELVKRWPGKILSIKDSVCGAVLFQRLEEARAATKSPLEIDFHTSGGDRDLEISASGEEARIFIRVPGGEAVEHKKTLPYRVQLGSERGRRSIAEWVIWLALRAAVSRQP